MVYTDRTKDCSILASCTRGPDRCHRSRAHVPAAAFVTGHPAARTVLR